jgi:hypothetical protein
MCRVNMLIFFTVEMLLFGNDKVNTWLMFKQKHGSIFKF